MSKLVKLARSAGAKLKNAAPVMMAFAAPHAFALNNQVDLGGNSSGPLEKVTKLFQEFADWLGGPGVMMVVFLAMIAAWALWVIVPKSSGTALGYLARAIAGGLFLFNIALIFSWMEGF